MQRHYIRDLDSGMASTILTESKNPFFAISFAKKPFEKSPFFYTFWNIREKFRNQNDFYLLTSNEPIVFHSKISLNLIELNDLIHLFFDDTVERMKNRQIKFSLVQHKIIKDAPHFVTSSFKEPWNGSFD